MSGSVMAFVERKRVTALKPLHSVGEIRLRSLDEEMHVVRHQAIAEEAPALTKHHGREQCDVPPVVVVIHKYAATVDAARDDVMDPVDNLEAQARTHTS